MLQLDFLGPLEVGSDSGKIETSTLALALSSKKANIPKAQAIKPLNPGDSYRIFIRAS